MGYLINYSRKKKHNGVYPKDKLNKKKHIEQKIIQKTEPVIKEQIKRGSETSRNSAVL